MIDYRKLWPETYAEKARSEGWQLALVVNEGDPVTKSFYMVFECEGGMQSRGEAMRHVAKFAQQGSKLHRHAVEAVIKTRTVAGPTKRKKA